MKTLSIVLSVFIVAVTPELIIEEFHRHHHADISTLFDHDSLAIMDFEESLNYDIRLLQESCATEGAGRVPFRDPAHREAERFYAMRRKSFTGRQPIVDKSTESLR